MKIVQYFTILTAVHQICGQYITLNASSTLPEVPRHFSDHTNMGMSNMDTFGAVPYENGIKSINRREQSHLNISPTPVVKLGTIRNLGRTRYKQRPDHDTFASSSEILIENDTESNLSGDKMYWTISPSPVVTSRTDLDDMSSEIILDRLKPMGDVHLYTVLDSIAYSGLIYQQSSEEANKQSTPDKSLPERKSVIKGTMMSSLPIFISTHFFTYHMVSKVSTRKIAPTTAIYSDSTAKPTTKQPKTNNATCTCDSKQRDCCRRKLNCFFRRNQTVLKCWKGIPCEIPPNINELIVGNSNYLQMVHSLLICSYPCCSDLPDYNLDIKPINLTFSKITKLTLFKYDHSSLQIPKSSKNDFSPVFPSLERLEVYGIDWLDCSARIVLTVPKNLVTYLRTFRHIDVTSVGDFKLRCFRDVENLVISQHMKYFRKYHHTSIERPLIRLDVTALRSRMPELKHLCLKPIIYREIILFESVSNCNYSNLEQVYFASVRIWSPKVHIDINCKCNYQRLVFNVRDTSTTEDFKQTGEISIDGFLNVWFIFKQRRSCAFNNSNPLYGNVMFTFGSKLLIQQHCNNNTLEISINNFYKGVTYLIWYFHRLEISPWVETDLKLSSLGIRYFLFPERQGGVFSLAKNVLLSQNHLGTMATYENLDFEKILYTFQKLEKIDLASNEIEELPDELFSRSPYLKAVNLSNNKLSVLKISHFYKIGALIELDLSNNRIKTLYTQLQLVNSFLFSRNGLIINMSGNDFICSCARPDIFTDTYKLIQAKALIAVSKCKVSDINSVWFSNLEGQCQKKILMLILIYSLSITGGLIFLVLISLCVFWRMRKQKRLVDRFVHDVKHGNAKKEYLVFLSFSSTNGNMVHRLVKPELEKRLIERTGVEKEHICTGDTHFIPGFNIIQEAMRCINLCSVVVFVVSKSFIVSPFCRMEVKEALDQAKPIILIMKIRKYKIPRIIKSIFKKYSRFHFIRDRAGIRVLPSWDVLVSAIFDLAAYDQKDLKILESLEKYDKKIKRK